MRQSEILFEKIVNRPRDLRAFLNLRIKLLDHLIPEVERAVQFIKNGGSRDGERTLEYCLRYVDRDAYLPDAYYIDLVKRYELQALRDNLSSVATYGARDFMQYAIGTLEHIKPMDDEPRQALAALRNIEQGFRDYGYEPGTPATDDDEEYRDARALANAYLLIANALPKVEALLDGIKPVLMDYKKRQQFAYDPDKYRPDHEAVETLYHASLFAAEIAAEGFKAEKPIERQGVGNYGAQNEISFTHDLRIAQDIMRALREMWMIMHGKLTRREIIGWMNHEGIDVARAEGLYMRSREPKDTPEQTVRLYRAYLGYTKLRADPVFVNVDDLLPLLADRPYKSIGIVSCEVRLDGEERYLQGEAEFRVPASRVVGPIKRIT